MTLPDHFAYIDHTSATMMVDNTPLVTNLHKLATTKSSIIFQGHHTHSDQRAVVKTINPEHTNLEVGREVLLAEIQAHRKLAHLNHVNLVTFLGGYDSESPAIVTEFVGPSLISILSEIRQNSLPKFTKAGLENIFRQLRTIYQVFQLVGGHYNITPSNLLAAASDGSPIYNTRDVKPHLNSLRIKAIDPGNLIEGHVFRTPGYIGEDWADICTIISQITVPEFVQ